MIITLEVPPGLESEIRKHAATRDAVGVRRLLAEALDPVVEKMLNESGNDLSGAEFEALAEQLADEWAKAAEDPMPSQIDDSREGIYAGHPKL